jgi:hypothetical protein
MPKKLEEQSDSNNILYVYNRFYQGNPNYGETSSWEMIWRSFLTRVNVKPVIVFNPDEYGLDSAAKSDSALMDVINSNRVSHLIMIYHIGIGWKRDFISNKTLNSIKQRGIKITAIWGDIQIPAQRKTVKKLSKQVDLNVMTASHAAFSRFGSKIDRYYSWVPLERDAKERKKCECSASVSFAGAAKNNRVKFLKAIKESGIDVHIGGGEGKGTLTRDDYLTLIAHPISISFSGSRLEPLVNARTFEVISQGSLLMEQWGRETPKFLIPYVDYVPWFNKRDLVEKVRFYSDNPKEAKKIALNGKIKFESLSDDRLWEIFCNSEKNQSKTRIDSFTRVRYEKDLNLGALKNRLFMLLDFLSCRKAFSLIFNLIYQLKSLVSRVSLYWRIIRRRTLRLLKNGYSYVGFRP